MSTRPSAKREVQKERSAKRDDQIARPRRAMRMCQRSGQIFSFYFLQNFLLKRTIQKFLTLLYNFCQIFKKIFGVKKVISHKYIWKVSAQKVLKDILAILRESEKTICKIEILFARGNKSLLPNWSIAGMNPKKFDHEKLSNLEKIDVEVHHLKLTLTKS